MRYLPVLVVIALVTVTVGAATSSVARAGNATVTSSGDAGAGSFRAAVELANDNASIGHIVFTGNLDPIELQSTVLYDGPQSLSIVGNGAVLDGTDLTGTSDAFRAETPGDLSVIGLTVANAAGEGLEYQVPANASGTKQVSLNGVRVLGGDPKLGRGGHGVLLNDQTFPDEAGDALAQHGRRADHLERAELSPAALCDPADSGRLGRVARRLGLERGARRQRVRRAGS